MFLIKPYWTICSRETRDPISIFKSASGKALGKQIHSNKATHPDVNSKQCFLSGFGSHMTHKIEKNETLDSVSGRLIPHLARNF